MWEGLMKVPRTYTISTQLPALSFFLFYFAFPFLAIGMEPSKGGIGSIDPLNILSFCFLQGGGKGGKNNSAGAYQRHPTKSVM